MSKKKIVKVDEGRLEVLNQVLAGLMKRYVERVPNVMSIVEEMKKERMIKGMEDIENDHIAFRTIGVNNLGIKSFEKIFLHLGYQKMDYYHFSQKKLDAFWYSPPQSHYPRIFVSELLLKDLDEKLAKIIYSYTNEVVADPVDLINLDNAGEIDNFLHKGLWRCPTLKDFEILQKQNEYASWVIYNRYYLNHFTISVNNLPKKYRTIKAFNSFLKGRGYKLNQAGGEIKTSDDGKLIQSSTVAALVKGEFDDGQGGVVEKMIPGSYIEFAERLPLDEFAHLCDLELKRKHLRDGFETGNADKIFESTSTDQIQNLK